MPTTLFDEAGKAVENVLTPEEATALTEEKAKIETELAATKTRLAGLQDKDFNFRRLEQMTQEERDKLSSEQTELLKRQEALEDQQKSFAKTQEDTYKQVSLSQFGISTPEDQEKVLKNYDRISDVAKSPAEIAAKMREAAAMAGFQTTAANPLTVAMGMSGAGIASNSKETAKSYAETDAGKALAADLGMQISKPKADSK